MRQTEIEQLLPGVFQRTAVPGSPLYALLGVMEALHAPSEAVLAGLEQTFNPYHTPDRFVPYLSGWVDLERLILAQGDPATTFPPGLGRLRGLIAAAAYLSKWRGTARGLLRFLEVATGVKGFEIDEAVTGPAGRPLPFHIRVRAPAGAEPYRELVERIVEMEKPAYVTFDLAFG